MQKYAFIENVPGLSKTDYHTEFNDGEWISYVIGLDGIDACMDCAKQMIADGCSMINLCGDFNDGHVKELMKNAPEGTEVHYAAYLPEELEKREALSEYTEYGMIIFGGVEEPKRFELLAPEMNTHTVFIKDLNQAIAVAEDFAKSGVHGIELCSSFDGDMTRAVMEAVSSINDRIPVGSNGLTK